MGYWLVFPLFLVSPVDVGICCTFSISCKVKFNHLMFTHGIFIQMDCAKCNYCIFSIKLRAPIKRWPRFNARSKRLLFKLTPGAFDRGPGVYLRLSRNTELILFSKMLSLLPHFLSGIIELAYHLKPCTNLPQYCACIVCILFFYTSSLEHTIVCILYAMVTVTRRIRRESLSD